MGKSKKKINKIRVAFILCCVTIPVIQWLIFYVYANFSSIIMAFQNDAEEGAFTLMHFQRFLKEFQLPTSEIYLAFKNTFLTFGILVLVFPFKVMVSFFIYKKIPLAGFYRIIFFLPTIIFSVAIALIFQRLMSVDGFIAQTVAKWLEMDYTPEFLADTRFANTVVLANLLWLGFPGDLIIWGGTFARIPEEVLESGKIDGTTWWTEFTRIVVPLVWPTVALQMVLLSCGKVVGNGLHA